MSLEKKQISIIIAAWNGFSCLRECLSSIEKQAVHTRLEVIVISNFSDGISECEKIFPFALFFILPPQTTVPELRSEGINRAQGSIVAFIEDFCILDSAWCGEILKAHELPYQAIGGAVENTGSQKALDWAVYFYDYGKYMLPIHPGTTDTLSEMNVSYKKASLETDRIKNKNGFLETSVNKELKCLGHELYLHPPAVVYHNKNYKLKKISFQFFHQARVFAANRAAGSSFTKQLIFVMGSLILPLLLPFRVILRTIKRKRHIRKLALSLPYLLILTSVWASGEFFGYLIGEGRSGRQWK